MKQLSILVQSARTALFSLRSDPFRTSLSLLGVAIGIFSVIAPLALVEEMNRGILSSLEFYGEGMALIQQFPIDEEEAVREEYFKRPKVTFGDYRFLAENTSYQGVLSFTELLSLDISRGSEVVAQSDVAAVAGDWQRIVNAPLACGSSFGEYASESTPQALIGWDIYKKLFFSSENENLGEAGEENEIEFAKTKIGEKIKIGSRELRIAGIFRRQGGGSVNILPTDHLAIIPYSFAKNNYNLDQTSTFIAAIPEKGISEEESDNTLRSALRTCRRLSPRQSDNFSINHLSFIARQSESMARSMQSAGWVIGLFSLLIGAFSIANILFVSVKERTPQIGIEKALGAHPRMIVAEFLCESVILAVLGGAAGIGAVFLTSVILPLVSAMTLSLTPALIGAAFSIAIVTGILSGVAPAFSAARLNPVEAINYV